ncbi:hypothetical protein [Ottowia thiooxydans]|uniref:hypothetical protein n=1 Tax=Ottowia thiooxydans TaxID=219182 RepID=UPI0003FDF77C|nr:hypothetical protein [Ottowia thiooxydans]
MRGSLVRWKRAVLVAACAGALAACGGGSSDVQDVGGGDHGHDPDHGHVETAGRLVVLEPGSNQVHVIDLDAGSVMQSYIADGTPSAVYASPDRRYAVVFQATQNQVQFVDGGIYQEPHADHMDDKKESPRLMNTRLSGVRPSHYESHGELAAVFFDGNAATNANASIALLSDESIGKPSVTLATQGLSSPMHGTAEPRGDWLLTTWKAPETAGTTPTHVELYERHGDHFHQAKRFEQECPGLHGSYSNTNYTAFGCSDGVLVIRQAGQEFTAQKIPNPASMASGVRISTIIGNDHMTSFVGIGSGGNMFEIDPVAGAIKRIDWAEGRVRRAHALDAEGASLLVLDDIGTLHILSTKDWSKRAALTSVISSMPTAAPYPALAVSANDDKVWISDPQGRRLHAVDIGDAAVKGSVALNFNPGGLTWLGISAHAH